MGIVKLEVQLRPSGDRRDDESCETWKDIPVSTILLGEDVVAVGLDMMVLVVMLMVVARWVRIDHVR